MSFDKVFLWKMSKIGIQLLWLICSINLINSRVIWSNSISTVGNVVKLIINYQAIQSTKGLGNYTKLTHVNLNNNILSSIGEIYLLSKLNSLYLQTNQIRSLNGLENLALLQELDVSFNLIGPSLAGIETLTILEILVFNSNQIERLQELKKLTRITSLTAYSNQIKSHSLMRCIIRSLSLFFSPSKQTKPGSRVCSVDCARLVRMM